MGDWLIFIVSCFNTILFILNSVARKSAFWGIVFGVLAAIHLAIAIGSGVKVLS